MKKISKYYSLITVIITVIVLAGCKKEEVPVIATSSVSNITAVTATSGGNITDEGSSTVITRGVCWSTSITPTIADNKTTDGAGAGSFTSNLTVLNGATSYFVRAYASNSVGTGYGMAMSFTTFGQSPSPTISASTNLSDTGAKLNGTVNANYLSSDVTFEYGTTTSYGSTKTANQSPVTGNSITNVSADISGLNAATIYHCRIVAVNSLGTTFSNDITFTTLGQIPTISTEPATNLTTISATLNGIVNANYLSTIVSFEYGTTTSYGSNTIANESPVTGSTITNVSVNITGLTLGLTYHFRVKAVNSLGTAYGSDMQFLVNHVIGDNYAGGTIFYIDGTGQHGLVCAPTNQSTGVGWYWGTLIATGAIGTALGTGMSNTSIIVSTQPSGVCAAKLCDNLVLGGFSDWYLPSKDELNLLFLNKSVMGELASAAYWSSSENGTNTAWCQFLDTGAQSSNHPKSDLHAVRAIRSY